MTDGKSIVSGLVLIEHMAGEQKHLVVSRHLKALIVEATAANTRQSTGEKLA